MDKPYQHLPDSYTAYRTKIGLATDPDRFLADRGEVVLNWPYKDCVLAGGQDKENAERTEKFYHPVLAANEVNRLLEPKAFTNWQRHNHHGDQPPSLLHAKENYLIKGNNLVVLHSLYRRFAERIKLIYIDVPYNTGNDSFMYNDTFTHSTWLTFMRNRLEIARKLLTNDGTIMVQADWHEVHYLKVLMDEIFGREQLINEIIWCYTGPGSPQMRQLNRKHDTILWYAKDIQQYTFNKDAIRVAYADPHQTMRKSLSEGTWDEEDEAKMRARGRVPDDWWSDIPVAARAAIDGVRRTGYPTEKPPKLLDRIVAMATNPADYVLDFFAGSGTSLYAAARAGRHFIGVEQLRGAYRIMLQRMRETASFVSCELLGDAARFLQQVDQAADSDLPTLFQTLRRSIFLTYQVDPQKLELAEFERLDAASQRALLHELVDQNMLYINYADMDDPDLAVSELDRKLNHLFYHEEV